MRLLAFFSFLLAAVAQPASAQVLTPPQLQSLERRLAALASENPGEYGIAAMDLETGALVSFNGDEPFPMASTMKIAVAAAYLSQVDAGRRSLDAPIGNSTALTLMDLMITRSSNPATDQLIAALGGPAVVDNWLRTHQLSGIRVDRNIAGLLSARRDLHDIRDSSTPEAMLGLLRLIDSGNALSPGSRAILLDMMRRCRTGSNRIRGLLPPGVTVENKTGTLNGYTGDVGFLTMPDGRRIAVAFFARGGSNRPAVISTAARAIYDTFGPARRAPVQAFQNLANQHAAAAPAPSVPPASACAVPGFASQASC
ncbi:MAG TPA: serine hydrolase [Allosphingosinicella sp.]|nr:serine hydrolase [Allosphingosinicella sp.]